MVEVPAAVLLANEIFPGVDFVSIGTNDLSQYTYAADRLLAPLAALNDHWQPALARLVDLACIAAQRCGTPVGVCGESASDPAYAAVLVGLGARSLSMPARSLAAVNELLAKVTLDQCQAAARAAHSAWSAAAAKRHVRAVLPQLDELGL
jgi:phosphotransferase system enzyme I (PtsI)